MKWSVVKAGWLGAIFGIAVIFFQEDVSRIYVEYGLPSLAASILGGAAGGILLFGTAAAIRNLFAR